MSTSFKLSASENNAEVGRVMLWSVVGCRSFRGTNAEAKNRKMESRRFFAGLCLRRGVGEISFTDVVVVRKEERTKRI